MQSFGTVAAPSLWFWFVLLFCWFLFRKRNSTQWQTTCTIITPWWYYCRTTMVSKTCHPLPWKLSRIKKTWTTATCWYWCSTTRLYHFFGPHYHYEIEIKNVKFKFKVCRVHFFWKTSMQNFENFIRKKQWGSKVSVGILKRAGTPKFCQTSTPQHTPTQSLLRWGVFWGFFLVP